MKNIKFSLNTSIQIVFSFNILATNSTSKNKNLIWHVNSECIQIVCKLQQIGDEVAQLLYKFIAHQINCYQLNNNLAPATIRPQSIRHTLMPSTDPEVKILDTIIQIEQQQHEVKVSKYYSAFVVHFAFKIVPLLLLAGSQLLALAWQQMYTQQLTILFIVFQFWFTKNITGKRMLGVRWFFGNDEYGVERLMFECRANPQYIDFIKPKLFWIIQFAYCIIPVLFILEAIFHIPNTPTIDFKKIALCLLVMASGIANNFFFLKVGGTITEQQEVLKTRLGSDGLSKIGLGSITSHF